MKKNKHKMQSLKFMKKLIASIFMMTFTAITLTSTTFAWFARNTEAWIEQFDLELGYTDSLLISIDGKNYLNAISNDNLKKAVVAKKYNLDILANEETFTPQFVNTEFNKIVLESVTTKDLNQFYAIDDKEDNIKNNTYQLKEASRNNYISFDLWFRLEISKAGAAGASHNLTLVSKQYSEDNESRVSYINAEPSAVKLYNKLTTLDKDTGLEKIYHSGDIINVNAKDAMRLGIKTDETSYIYELSEGLGSYAIQGETGIYNPQTNAMLTYFNNTHEAQLNPIKNEDKDYYQNTLKDFNTQTSFGVFKPNEDKSSYNDIKITVSIWLEGYDADYFAGIDTSSVRVFLNFCSEMI